MYTSKAPLIAKVCKQGGSWPALWDTVRHLGSRHTVGLQHLSRMQAHHGRGPKPCPLCEEQLSGVTLTDHVLSSHNQEFQLPSLTPERQQRLRHRMSCGTSQDNRRLNHSTDDGSNDDVFMT